MLFFVLIVFCEMFMMSGALALFPEIRADSCYVKIPIFTLYTKCIESCTTTLEIAVF